jgi:hypothetical protein
MELLPSFLVGKETLPRGGPHQGDYSLFVSQLLKMSESQQQQQQGTENDVANNKVILALLCYSGHGLAGNSWLRRYAIIGIEWA